MSGGTKRSSFLILRRRLLLVRQLFKNAATSAVLIEAIQAQLGEEGYPTSAESAFRRDLDALKHEYRCRIVYDRRTQQYKLDDPGLLSLLDLPKDCQDALVQLNVGSTTDPTWLTADLQQLLARVLLLLPREQRDEHYRRLEKAIPLASRER